MPLSQASESQTCGHKLIVGFVVLRGLDAELAPKRLLIEGRGSLEVSRQTRDLVIKRTVMLLD